MIFLKVTRSFGLEKTQNQLWIKTKTLVSKVRVVDVEARSKTDNLMVYGIQRGVTEESHLELRDSLNYVKMHNAHQMKFDQERMIPI